MLINPQKSRNNEVRKKYTDTHDLSVNRLSSCNDDGYIMLPTYTGHEMEFDLLQICTRSNNRHNCLIQFKPRCSKNILIDTKMDIQRSKNVSSKIDICKKCDMKCSKMQINAMSTELKTDVLLSAVRLFSATKYFKNCNSYVHKSTSPFGMLQHLIFQLVFLLMCSHIFVHESSALFVNEPVNDNLTLTNKSNRSILDFNGTKRWDTFLKPFANPNLGGAREAYALALKVGSKTTKRSVSDIFLPHLTTVATPLLTTMRFLDKTHHQQQINFHHRNYELDLERDHALPTSAPNADILKSNSNPTYPNPNRHHSHERDRHRHLLNSTPQPSLPNILKNTNNQSPTIPMYPGEVPSYSPPARSFFTPPLPPEYQHPFADKPTLRGTNNDGNIANAGTYIIRRPIPPPSLMPGHERIPFRPPEISSVVNEAVAAPVAADGSNSDSAPTITNSNDFDRKKVLNTPSRTNDSNNYINNKDVDNIDPENIGAESFLLSAGNKNPRQEVLPSIRRILSGSNGKKGEIPEVLLKQVTQRPAVSYHQPPASPVVLLDGVKRQQNEASDEQNGAVSSVINKINSDFNSNVSGTDAETSGADQSNDKARKKISNGNTLSSTQTDFITKSEVLSDSSTLSTTRDVDSKFSSITPSTSTIAAAAAAHATWTIAWNTHVYLSVILFTILAVYSLYKLLTYNKLTHLFSQSYFVCIHLILIIICSTRIFYLCFDAYNIHASFHMFVSEILLNLPATLLSTSFAVLILYLFLKSLNHKNNRYSALIRPLTVVVGCGVHVVLCITLHYVESYTTQNHQQQLYYQQQQQQHLYRKHHSSYQHYESSPNIVTMAGTSGFLNSHQNGPAANFATLPPRVLSLICQIIYIFVCLSLGLLYLYLYRILKRILRSKSQNYIHGYQNLSYAIHITIATALLFVLLAALQIFGVISIPTTRSIVTQSNSEMDWLQWGYQFSLRLIEIAIVTLISWVAGLKTSNNSSGSNGTGLPNGTVPMSNVGAGSAFGSGTGDGNREKHGYNNHHNHSNMAGFFLPCTSSSSQEQFETDYPAVCNANTNLHTYTMRTGKLIYDDSFVLTSLANVPQSGVSRIVDDNLRNDFQMQQPTYQHPYDTGSIQSSINHNVGEYGTLPGNHRYHRRHSPHDNHQYSDYLTDGTTDHYENPNFDLRGPVSTSSVPQSGSQKFVKTSTTSTNASSSAGSGSISASHQQMLLLQNDNCYSEPLQESDHGPSNLNFNNFERPKFAGGTVVTSVTAKVPLDYWSDQHNPQLPPCNKRDKKNMNTTNRAAFENSERRSSNSNHSFTSNGGVGRYGANGYNSFDRSHYNKGIRKSGTLSNFGASVLNGQNVGAASSEASTHTAAQRPAGVQTLAAGDRYHLNQRNMCVAARGINESALIGQDFESDALFSRGSYNRKSDCVIHSKPHQGQQTSDEDDMLSGGNVECTNLINNDEGSCITNSSSTNSACGNLTDQGICSNSTNSERLIKQNLANRQHLLAKNKSHSQITQNNIHNLINQNHSSGHDTASATSSNSGTGTPSDSIDSVPPNEPNGSMLVAEHGFVRFRAIDDMNNAQGIGIHNASIRNQNRNSSTMTPA